MKHRARALGIDTRGSELDYYSSSSSGEESFHNNFMTKVKQNRFPSPHPIKASISGPATSQRSFSAASYESSPAAYSPAPGYSQSPQYSHHQYHAPPSQPSANTYSQPYSQPQQYHSQYPPQQPQAGMQYL